MRYFLEHISSVTDCEVISINSYSLRQAICLLQSDRLKKCAYTHVHVCMLVLLYTRCVVLYMYVYVEW